MESTSSPATAENPAPDGVTPPAETQTAPAPDAVPQPVEAGESLEEIRAQLRANSGALATPRVATDNWNVLDDAQPTPEEQEQAEADAAAADAAQAEADQTAKAEADAAAADAQAKAEADAAKRKDPARVRITRFAEDDRKVIARMAEKDGLTIDQARAELIAEGVLSSKPAAASAPSVPSDDLAAKQTEIAEIEKQIEDAATAFDTPKLAKLQIAHNKALHEIGKLEAKAESAAAESQAQELTKLQTEVNAAAKYATELYPDLDDENSELSQVTDDLIAAAPPSAFVDPDWPVTFAAKAARQINYRPPASAAAAPKPTPAVVPKKPARPVPPSPASGATPGATSTKQPTAAEMLEAAGDDPDKIKAVLRRVGTPFGS
jgi:hypothetical protein